jgi:hypothetical protein
MSEKFKKFPNISEKLINMNYGYFCQRILNNDEFRI